MGRLGIVVALMWTLLEAPIATAQSGAGTTLFRRDIEGAVTGVTPPEQPEHAFDYSAIGQNTEYRPPGVTVSPTPGACPLGATCVVYDSARRVQTLVRASGQTVTPAYNATTGLVDAVAVSGEGSWTFGYEPGTGRLVRETAPDGGELVMSYQSDLPITLTQQGSHTVTDAGGATVWSGALDGRMDVTYTNELRAGVVAVTGGMSVTYGYDLDGLVTSVADTAGVAPAMTLVRSALDGHLESATLGGIETTLALDVDPSTPGFGDFLGTTTTVAGAEVYDASYEHDRLGRIVTWRETVLGEVRERRFEYDDAGRLVVVRDDTGAVRSEYAYDAQGNRTLVDTPLSGGRIELGTNLGCDVTGTGALTKAANFQDQLCRYGDFEYTFDADGRLSEKRSLTSGETTRYRYAGDGRLLDVELPSSSRVSYVHDAHGRRIGRVVDGVLERGWLYKDGINPIAQLDAAGNVEWTFVYATRAHVPDYMVHATDGRVLRFIVDHLGSVRLLVDVATGAIVERMDYDEYGRVEGASGAWSVQPFGYAGGLYDPDTGLVRFGARDYDPETGRWTAKDPIGFGGGDTNLYAYAGGDPINFIDPTGLDVWEFIFGGKLGWLFPDKGPPGQFWPVLDDFVHPKLGGEKPFAEVALFGLAFCGGGGGAAARGSAATRAKEVHSVLDPRAARARTTAVTETAKGTRVVSSSQRRLTPTQRAALGPGEVEGVGVGHAEVTGVNAAREMGLTPTGAAASRPICPECATFLEGQGVTPLSPLK